MHVRQRIQHTSEEEHGRTPRLREVHADSMFKLVLEAHGSLARVIEEYLNSDSAESHKADVGQGELLAKAGIEQKRLIVPFVPLLGRARLAGRGRGQSTVSFQPVGV